ncbi:MAG: cyclic nucleotide-binding domain-containing protein [Nitrospirae bacterium]|nr:cyclic nucleotide-binding domain-containing protein [Nitrospirota bacterium]
MGKSHWESYFEAVKNQNWDKAMNSLTSISKQETDNSQVHLKMGDIFQKTGAIDKAITEYHQSAWLLMNNGFLQKALAIFKIILRLDPNNAEAINKSKELMMELESARTKKPMFTEFVPTGKEEGSPQSVITKEAIAFSIPEFLESLPEDEARDLISTLKPQSFSSGQTIIEEGDSGDSIFVIKSGHVLVVAHILGKEIELATLSEGDVFGEVAFLTGRPRTASVIAADNLEIIEFNRIILEEIFAKYPDTLKKIEDFYHLHVRDTIEKVKSTIKK